MDIWRLVCIYCMNRVNSLTHIAMTIDYSTVVIIMFVIVVVSTVSLGTGLSEMDLYCQTQFYGC